VSFLKHSKKEGNELGAFGCNRTNVAQRVGEFLLRRSELGDLWHLRLHLADPRRSLLHTRNDRWSAFSERKTFRERPKMKPHHGLATLAQLLSALLLRALFLQLLRSLPCCENRALLACLKHGAGFAFVQVDLHVVKIKNQGRNRLISDKESHSF